MTAKIPTVTLTVHEFHTLVKPVLPLASTDDMLPVINAIRLEVRGDYLCAFATDRFRAGVQRIKPQHGAPAGFEALVKLRDITRLLQLFKPVRGQDPADVTFTIEDNILWATSSGGLGFDFADMRIGSALEISEFPNMLRLFTDQLGEITPASGEVLKPGGSFGMNPDYLASFKAAASVNKEPAVFIRPPASVRRPLIVQVGDDFLGMVMQRRVHGAEWHPDTGADWLEFLTEKPKVKRATKKAAAAEAVSA